MRNPLMVKKSLTPRPHPKLSPPLPAWFQTTMAMARVRRPSSSPKYFLAR